MVKIAVLGAGFMGGTHARALAKLPGVQVVGVSSRQEEKAAALAQEVGAQPTTDALALATDPGVDAVSITLPTYLHREYAVAALRAGKHVLLEKPMALTVEECDEIIEAHRRSDSVLMLSHTLRFWPEYHTLAEFVHSGTIGKPIAATALRQVSPPAWSPWFQDAELSGGEVLDLHIHDLDALNWLFGPPVSLYSRGQRGPSGGYDLALTLVDYGDVQCFAEGNALMPEGFPFTMALNVQCENGVVEYALRAGGAQVDSRESGWVRLQVIEAGKPPRALEGPTGDPYARTMAAFVEAVEQGRQPVHGTPEQGRLAVKCALAARESIETNQVIYF